MDQDQLQAYKEVKRKQFQDKVRRQRYHIGLWLRYAKWEESLSEFRNARSIFERALQIEYTNKSIWLKYAQFQMRHKFIIHARNVWERAIYFMPREDQFWYKYTYMEEVLGEYELARNIFQRWVTWAQASVAWDAYIKFQERLGQRDKATLLNHRCMNANPSIGTYLATFRYQLRNKNRKAARVILEKAVPDLGRQAYCQEYFLEFAKFQLSCKQIQRARAIFQFGLNNLKQSKRLGQAFLSFQKQHGTKATIDQAVLRERRQSYNKQISQDGTNYDSWISLAELQCSAGNFEQTRSIYEKAVTQLPPVKEKRYWRRYVYVWYNYAIFQETVTCDLQRANQVYRRALKSIPVQFSFSQLYVMFALFLVRKGELQRARKLFGQAIGKHPRPKIFRCYIELEEQLCNLDRVRTIYEKYVECFPWSQSSWLEWAEFEKNYEQHGRSRRVLEVAKQLGVSGIQIPND